MRSVVVALAILVSAAGARSAAAKCVQIYHDGPANGGYGRQLATLMRNLMGHFPAVRDIVVPVRGYVTGQIGRCETTIFIGANPDSPIPQAFLDDFAGATTTVAWVGYNVEQLSAATLRRLWGVKYDGQGELAKRKDAKGVPGHFRDYEYRGETFFKKGYWENQKYHVDADVTLLEILEPEKSQVVSWMKHSTTNERRPYLLHAGNHWLVNDIPLSLIHEEDRYLIFADVLFDLLGEQPKRTTERLALVRFEDVHAALPRHQVKALIDAAKAEQVPFVVSLIPTYRHAQPAHGEPREVRLPDSQPFVQLMQEAEANGGSLIMHGFTHQSDNYKNPDGPSGIDYEFWDQPRNRPMPNDSAEFALGRLEQGLATMQQAGFTPVAWVTPHYMGSATNNVVFAQTFDWSIGRALYVPHTVTQREKLPAELRLNRASHGQTVDRRRYFTDLRVETQPETQPEGVFFPYELYGDIHGANLVPETVGYIRPGHGEPPWLVDDMIRVLRRNRVLRDAWGSFFVHPFLVETTADGGIARTRGDTTEIRRLFREAKALGYTFVSMKEWVRTHR